MEIRIGSAVAATRRMSVVVCVRVYVLTITHAFPFQGFPMEKLKNSVCVFFFSRSFK